MITINPVEYPRLIKRIITVISVSSDKRKIQLDLSKDAGLRLYYGKLVTFIIDNSTYIGTYVCEIIRKSVAHYLVVDQQVNISAKQTITIYEAPAVINDNQSVTIQDIYERCISNESKVQEYGESEVGKPGLLSGLNTLKLNHIAYDFKKDTTIDLNNQYTILNNLRVYDNTISHYRIFLYNTDNKTLFDAELAFAPKLDYYAVKVISHLIDTNNETLSTNNFCFKFNKVVYENGEVYAQINIKLQNSESSNVVLNGYIGCAKADDILVPEDSAVAINEVIKLNGLEEIICYKNTISFDTYGEQVAPFNKETMFRGTTINGASISSQYPGFYIINNDLYKPVDIPGGTNDYSMEGINNDKKFTIDWTKGNLIIYPTVNYQDDAKNDLNDNRCLLITDNKRVFIGTLNRTGNNIDWFELVNDEHTHYAKDIIEDAEHRFVTDEQIIAWNKGVGDITNSPWRPSVNSESNFPQNVAKGYTVTVLNSTTYTGKQVVYQYDGTKWNPISVNVLPVDATTDDALNGLQGSLISPAFLLKLQTLGIGYILNTGKEQYVSTLNDESIYGTTENKFYDLVKRTGTALVPGNNSINIGFDNDLGMTESLIIGSNNKSNSKSIVIGNGLLSEDNKIIIGNYNENISNTFFEIGIGADDNNRKTAIWLTKNNVLNLAENIVLTAAGKTIDDIFVSGGFLKASDFVSKSYLAELLNSIPTLDNWGYFEHELKDGTKTRKEYFVGNTYLNMSENYDKESEESEETEETINF